MLLDAWAWCVVCGLWCVTCGAQQRVWRAAGSSPVAATEASTAQRAREDPRRRPGTAAALIGSFLRAAASSVRDFLRAITDAAGMRPRRRLGAREAACGVLWVREQCCKIGYVGGFFDAVLTGTKAVHLAGDLSDFAEPH